MLGVIGAALGLASAHHAAPREHTMGFGDKGALPLGPVVGVIVDHNPIAHPAQLVGAGGVGITPYPNSDRRLLAASG